MPTARELLEQADALMRRNRARDSIQRESPAPLPEIPVLTDAVEVEAPRVASAKAKAPDVPELTEVVTDLEGMPMIAEAEQGDLSIWLEAPDEDKSVLGAAPDSVAVVPPSGHGTPASERAPTVSAAAAGPAIAPDAGVAAPMVAAPTSLAPIPAEIENVEAAPPPAAEIDDEVLFDLENAPEPGAPTPPQPAAVDPQSLSVPVSADVAPGGGPASEERWRQLAEDVRMQVLQRIDMFTDTGLHEQLGARLKPIVDRASADLVDTINQHVGELLRSYVAEAIEREIERWRHDGER